MMDYYGSIVKTKESIRDDLVTHFRQPRKPVEGSTRGHSSGYSEEYIDALIERLGVYTPYFGSYSVTGWGVFRFPKWIRAFEDQIETDTENAKKKLLLAKISAEHPDFPRDLEITAQIASHIQ